MTIALSLGSIFGGGKTESGPVVVISLENFRNRAEQMPLFDDVAIERNESKERERQQAVEVFNSFESACDRVVSLADRFGSQGAADIRMATYSMRSAGRKFFYHDFEGARADFEHLQERVKESAARQEVLRPDGLHGKKVQVGEALDIIQRAAGEIFRHRGVGGLSMGQGVLESVERLLSSK